MSWYFRLLKRAYIEIDKSYKAYMFDSLVLWENVHILCVNFSPSFVRNGVQICYFSNSAFHIVVYVASVIFM